MILNEYLLKLEQEKREKSEYRQSEEFLISQKMARNKASDKKQFEEYRNVVGRENMPKSLDKFQEIKYNNIDEYYAENGPRYRMKWTGVTQKTDRGNAGWTDV